MTFQRIVLSAAQLRQYKPAFPLLNPHPLQALLDQVKPTAHTTPTFAFAVAIDMMGLDNALTFVQNCPDVLVVWTTMIEQHAWGKNTKAYDLQMNMLQNAIKTEWGHTASHSQANEGQLYQLIQRATQGNRALENALVTGLILNKGIELPWTLLVTLPENPSNENFGIWTDPRRLTLSDTAERAERDFVNVWTGDKAK